jgi:hypothetical protein
MSIDTVGTIHRNVLEGKSDLSWTIRMDEDLESAIETQLKPIEAAFKSQYGSVRPCVVQILPFDEVVVMAGGRSRISCAGLSDESGGNVHLLYISLAKGVCPRMLQEPDCPIISEPGYNLRISCTKV